jgi:transcriptional regulator with XRE-family HTH domain
VKEDVTMKLGDKIKKMRKDRKWSQAELAEKLIIHVTHVSRIETERFTPSLDLLKKLSEVFEVTADYLVFDSMENVGPINLKDKTLYEKMKLVDELEEKDRTIIHGVIDAFLVKQQMWNVLNKQINPA